MEETKKKSDQSSTHKIAENIPPIKSNFAMSLSASLEIDTNKVIAPDDAHNKIPILEIIPTPIGYPQV